MLALARKPGQTVRIGADILLIVLEVKGELATIRLVA